MTRRFLRIAVTPILLFGMAAMADQAAEPRQCGLNCTNGGICKFGIAEFGFAAEFQDDYNPLPFDNHKDGMYCACPTGFTGIHCEIAFRICGENEHTCFNGATCERSQGDFGEIFYHCECDAAHSDLSLIYAGHFCEHAATAMCHKPTVVPGQAPPRHSFCVNGGRCQDLVNHDEAHQGCDCTLGWKGPHCEFYDKAALDAAKTPKSNPMAGVLIFLFVAALLVVATVGGRILYLKKKSGAKKEQPKSGVELQDMPGEEPSLAMQKPAGLKRDPDEDEAEVHKGEMI